MSLANDNKDFFTYADYLTWPDDARWELIAGQPFAMTPAPTVRHQEISMNLSGILAQFFYGTSCKALASPIDVRLPKTGKADEQVDTVVQPDLIVVCDPAKIDEKGICGAPDLAIEILSASTAEHDLKDKLWLYEKHGVRCYIIVDPWGKVCLLRLLAPDGKYGRPQTFTATDMMPIEIFPGLMVDLARIFA